MAGNGGMIGGGIDLSYLKRDRSADQAATTASAGEPSEFKVAALVVAGTATNLRELLTASALVPVLVYFHSARSQESEAMLAELERLTLAANGRVLLVKIDADAAPELAQALGVSALPSLIAVLKNQPAPLFSASVPVEQLKPVFDKVLQVAADNGLNGVLTIDENLTPAEAPAPKQSELMLEGLGALEAGEYEKAIAAFEAELNQNPANQEAKLAIEQTSFLRRLGGVDLDEVLKAKDISTLEALLVLADAIFAAISPAQAFELLLENFAVADSDDRDAIRARLLSYFALAGVADPAVAAARVRLANLLF